MASLAYRPLSAAFVTSLSFFSLVGCAPSNCVPIGGDGGVAAVCGNRACEVGESATSCPADCSSAPPVCGNRACEAGETVTSCPADCTTAPPVCGNRACEAGETPASCPADCATGPVCGNRTCEAGETPATCPADCATPPICGNAMCEGGESPTTCPADCAGSCPSVAGDYLLGLAPAADPSCPPGTADVTVTQSGCSVTVDGIFPTPISMVIDPAGAGTYAYSFDGFPAVLSFFFSPGEFYVTDTGANALCPGLATRR